MRKSLFSLSVVVLSGLLLGVLSSCGTSSGSDTSYGPDGYNISYDSGSKVYAKLEKKANGKKKLVISGSGKIKDFSDKNSRPFASTTTLAKLIDEVSISDQVTYVGRNTFKDLSISSVVLPTSVTEIGYTIVSDGVNICSMGTTEVTQPAKSDATIYYYSEQAPAHDYHYYLKGSTDHSPEDITAGVTENSMKYWHYDGKDVAFYNKKKVLFIGNSFTFRNGTAINENGGIPRIFSEIAYNLNQYVETWAVMGSSLTLATHADVNSDTGKQIEKLLTTYSDFDAVVLQEQSTKPLTDETGFTSSANTLAQRIKATNPNARVILYETWGYPKACGSYGGTIQAMERSLRQAYNRCGSTIGADVMKVGSAFTAIYNDADHDVPLWYSDNMHQSYYGAYLSASIAIGTILGVDVTNTTYINDPNVDPLDQMTGEILTYVKNIAYNCVFSSDFNPDTDIVVENKELHIAVYDKYITEDDWNTLLTAYKTDANGRNVGTAKVTYTVYAGKNSTDPYYTAAALSAAISAETKEDGSILTDVIFPCGININSSGNMDNTIVTSARKYGYSDCTVFGQSSRYIARTNDNDMTMDFWNWMVSDAAKKIMDPSFTPATPDEPDTDPTVYDLKIAVWGRYITEANWTTLLTAFSATDAAKGKSIGYSYMGSSSSSDSLYKVDAYVAAVKTYGADILFPVGSNISEKYGEGLSQEAISTNVFDATSRYVAWTNENELTMAFKTWILSAEAQAIYCPTATA